MSAVGDNNGSDESTGGELPRAWHKGKQRQNSAERQVQELEEAEEAERLAVEARAVAEEALTPKEREERRRTEEADSLALAQRLQEYEVENEAPNRRGEKESTDHNKAETVELLGRGESPDANDVPDEDLDSDDESTDPEAGPKIVEGTKKRKRGSTKAKKARKNARIPEEKLVWGFHPEGGASQFANLTELTEFSSLRELPRSWQRVPCGQKTRLTRLARGCKKKKIGCPFVTRPVWNVRKNTAASGSKRPGRAGGSVRLDWAEDDVVLPAGPRTRLDDLRADVSALTGWIQELEASEELTRELLILTSRALLTTIQTSARLNDTSSMWRVNQRAEVPVEWWIESGEERKGGLCVLTPEPEEDADGEMDVDGPEEIRPEEKRSVEKPSGRKPPGNEPLVPNQEWLAGLEPAVIAQSEDTGDMELDGPRTETEGGGTERGGDVGEVSWRKAEKEREELERAKIAKQRTADEAEAARIEALMIELQSRRDALAANQAMKLELLLVKVPAQAQLLEDAPSGFRAALQRDGRVEFNLG
ncbi:hypothetical protein B0H14DRAFT_2650933 [Mycena olivaceomarginata]|nr:hypothetical protein B0H14DRAFT_2650933 [Mycena olivaceomarginata]